MMVFSARRCIPSRIFLGLLAALLVCVCAPGGAFAAGRVSLHGKSLGNRVVQVTCLLRPRVIRKSRQITIYWAYNSPSNYKAIGSTSQRVRGLSVKGQLTAGTHYFLCQVTLKSGRKLLSNRVKASVGSPNPTPTPTPRPTPRPTATPVPDLRACPSSYANDVIQRVNQARTGNGLAALTYNSQLQSAAQGHTNYMAKNQILDHDVNGGFVNRIRNAGFTGSPIGENIAEGYTTPAAVMSGWLGSAGHYANIMKSTYHYIGVGCIIDRYDRYWWTQNFGG